ncbi:MAG TPA: DUF1611 domain-containing protein [Steroidobacteraceae bacterium]|nr:DUF1611 domain-containing protein [Steroidobacteraceae bacterium]HQR49415.1 DUF1611 domain-containing protein [Steroidobacteraceae bacterium]
MPELVIRFDSPFVVFLGDITDDTYAKTGLGLAQWRRDDCIGQVRLPGCSVDAGVPDLTPAQAASAGARSLIVGSAAVGGGIPAAWVTTLCEAAAAGLDIVAGLHIRLASLPGLADAAARGRARLIDVRVPPPGLPVGTGRKRTGRRVITVGTDCACGKKYTALALDRELRRRGVASDFRATGQTGIMIAGRGMPIDAVVADFVTGAAEVLSPDNAPGHWDVIEGQGAIFHPGYLQVTAGLLVGSQPDAFVVCHDPLRTHVSGWEDFALPTIAQVIERTVAIGRITNAAIRCVGISLNTSHVPAHERAALLARHASESGLPCVDPLVEGMGAIAERLLEEFRA